MSDAKLPPLTGFMYLVSEEAERVFSAFMADARNRKALIVNRATFTTFRDGVLAVPITLLPEGEPADVLVDDDDVATTH